MSGREAAEENTTMSKNYECNHCGHPVMAEGISINTRLDVDMTGADRGRCEDTACVSSSEATVVGYRLFDVSVEGQRQ